MKAEYLADPNEAEQAADHYMTEFLARGAVVGDSLNLVVHVSGIQKPKLTAVESEVLRLYDCAHVERGERGFFLKKATLTAHLKPVPFDRINLLKAARALYRLILDHEVSVDITLV